MLSQYFVNFCVFKYYLFLVNNVSWLTDFHGDFIRIVLLSKPKKIKLQLTADPHNVLCPLIYSTIGLE